MDVPGALIAERYELRERIGVGGAATVFRALDRVLGREVALKRLFPGADADARARLRDEARLCGALSHPGIVRVLDYGEDGESPYLVMEYVDGPNLREVVRDGGPLPPERVMSIVAQLADALAVAHEAGIIHRDVKPGNILLRPDGTVALADFGIARSADIEPLTLTGMIVGTVDYISPEQAGGEGATERSDLYSLGMVAYECLTGVRPLRRDSQVATLLAHVHEDVPSPPRTVPPAVRDVVQRLTDRNPRRRPADAASAARLARAAAGLGAVAPQGARPHAGGVPRRRRHLVAVSLAAALAVVACGLWTIGRSGTAAPAVGADLAVVTSDSPSAQASAAPTPAPQVDVAVAQEPRTTTPAQQRAAAAPAAEARGAATKPKTAKKPKAAKKPSAAKKPKPAKKPKAAKAAHHGKAKGHRKQGR